MRRTKYYFLSFLYMHFAYCYGIEEVVGDYWFPTRWSCMQEKRYAHVILENWWKNVGAWKFQKLSIASTGLTSTKIKMIKILCTNIERRRTGHQGLKIKRFNKKPFSLPLEPKINNKLFCQYNKYHSTLCQIFAEPLWVVWSL